MIIKRPTSYGLRVVLAQSEKGAWVLGWISAITGIGASVVKNVSSPKHAAGYTWSCNGDAAESFLRQLLPFLMIKLDQAKLGVDFHKKMRDPECKSDKLWQSEVHTRMKTLNVRGPMQTYQLTVVAGG